jgi:large subunit ribosomal protein L6
MSRIGKQPIHIPAGVQVQLQGDRVRVKGALGELDLAVPPEIKIEQKEGQLILSAGKGAGVSALHGMMRARLANVVEGVCKGFVKSLEISGLGYKAILSGEKLQLNLGMTHPVNFDIPKGIKVEVDKKQTKVSVSGSDKELVGQTAARIRELKPPEPYKGFGIRYEGERVRRKAGKTAAGVGAGAAGAKK